LFKANVWTSGRDEHKNTFGSRAAKSVSIEHPNTEQLNQN
jgi:hypothetical protein